MSKPPSSRTRLMPFQSIPWRSAVTARRWPRRQMAVFVSLWDVATGKQKAMLKKGWPGADVEGVSSVVALSGDFKLLAVGVGGKEAKVYLWQLSSTKRADE